MEPFYKEIPPSKDHTYTPHQGVPQGSFPQPLRQPGRTSV